MAILLMSKTDIRKCTGLFIFTLFLIISIANSFCMTVKFRSQLISSFVSPHKLNIDVFTLFLHRSFEHWVAHHLRELFLEIIFVFFYPILCSCLCRFSAMLLDWIPLHFAPFLISSCNPRSSSRDLYVIHSSSCNTYYTQISGIYQSLFFKARSEDHCVSFKDAQHNWHQPQGCIFCCCQHCSFVWILEWM